MDREPPVFKVNQNKLALLEDGNTTHIPLLFIKTYAVRGCKESGSVRVLHTPAPKYIFG